MHLPNFRLTPRRAWIALCAILTPATVAAELNFSPCSITGSGGNGSLQAECATFSRPLNPNIEGGGELELFVGRLPSTAQDPAQDALTIINGGPGGSSVDLMVDLAPVLQAFTRERDVVVIDQRGTGRSAPLECEALTDSTAVLNKRQTIAATRDCLEKLPHDPRFFSTTVAVDDLEALRAAIGYSQLTVYGVSYGTRVALQYLRAYPDSTRALVIDGVVPPHLSLGGNVALNSHDTLYRVFDRCQRSPACAGRFPDLSADFDRLSARLREAPQTFTLQHPVSGEPTTIDLTYGHLAIWIRLALYAPETTALLPLIIDQAANHSNYLPVAASALRLLHQLTDSLNYGMHNAVVCTEDTPFYGADATTVAELAATYLGEEMYQTLKAMCSIWPEGIRDPDLKKPVVSDVPVLVLSGEFDPITPPSYGEAVLPGLSNAKHIIAPGQGHGTISRGCMPRVIRDFVESTSIDEVDDSCTDRLAPYPFFVDLMGPPP